MTTRLNISPTRMERTRQRERLQTATRAHKLLKDKYDEMVRTFLQLIKQNKVLREHVEKDLTAAIHLYLSATTQMTQPQIDDAIHTIRHQIDFDCSTRNIMGLVVPQVEINTPVEPTKTVLISTPIAFDEAINTLQQLTATLIELANIEQTCGMLADEIEKVRRRINSLEYNMIPSIQETIKFITMKLDENQRETQIRVMKVKEMQTQE